MNELYSFNKVEDTNSSTVTSLRLKSEQLKFIESVDDCLMEAKTDSGWLPLQICFKGQVIGFAMTCQLCNETRVWLDRFLIDQRFQGMGHGKRALKQLIQFCFITYQCNEIYLSLYEENTLALSLYLKQGFVLNGEVDSKGEKIMVLIKNKSA